MTGMNYMKVMPNLKQNYETNFITEKHNGQQGTLGP